MPSTFMPLLVVYKIAGKTSKRCTGNPNLAKSLTGSPQTNSKLTFKTPTVEAATNNPLVEFNQPFCCIGQTSKAPEPTIPGVGF